MRAIDNTGVKPSWNDDVCAACSEPIQFGVQLCDAASVCISCLEGAAKMANGRFLPVLTKEAGSALAEALENAIGWYAEVVGEADPHIVVLQSFAKGLRDGTVPGFEVVLCKCDDENEDTTGCPIHDKASGP